MASDGSGNGPMGDMMCQDEDTTGPGYNNFSNYTFNNPAAFRRRGYGMNRPPFHGEYGPPGPRFMWGRGFGPAGPPLHMENPHEVKTLRYLMRCGVPKQHLKGLPDALLRLMQPEYCGICGQRLDNLTVSRLHYVSKNHLKNQSKWLVQQAEVGSQHPREIPLRARDLYCELCDVQITSKTHAESHYAGRPHRAIVEGRKPPKNPFLLQGGMQERIVKLIRREKRNLKPIEESEATKDAKPVQPELYCEICKTSVTCSEQMTMHLNGKKHLSKEKHHIFHMMKGPTANKTSDAEPVNATENINEENKQNTNEDEYDWGNGSGAWDDIQPPQQTTDAM